MVEPAEREEGLQAALRIVMREVAWDDDAGHEAFVRAEEWERRYQPGRGRFFR